MYQLVCCFLLSILSGWAQGQARSLTSLTLQKKIGYNAIVPAYATTNALPDNDPFKPILKGIPASLKNVRFYRVTTGEQQFFYQQHLAGKLPKEYIDMYRLKFDSKDLQQTPMKVATYLLTAETPAGQRVWIADTNGDLEFSREPTHSLITYGMDRYADIAHNASTLTVQRVEEGKIKTYSIPFAICQSEDDVNQIYYNFPQYWQATLSPSQAVILHFANFIDYLPRSSNTRLVSMSQPYADRTSQTGESIRLGGYLTIGTDVYQADSIFIESVNKPTVFLKPVSDAGQIEAAQIGFLAPLFEEKELARDSLFNLKGLRGKYVLLDFWATWCGPCIREFPHLKKLTEQYGVDRLEVVGIIGDSKAVEAQKLVSDKGLTWRQVLSNKIVDLYKVSSFPTTFLISPEGRILYRDLRSEALDKTLAELLK